MDSAKQSIGKSLEQEMTLILGWSGEEVKIPAPVIMPQEFKETKEFRLRQQGKTSGDTTVFDTEGYKYVIRPYGIKKDSESGLKETMYFISRYRPNGILDADASYIDGVNFASEWQSYDVNGLKEVYIIRRPTSKDCKKKVRFYDRKGNKTKEWHVSEFDVVYGEMIIDTEGNSNFSYYLKDLIHSPYPQPPPVQVEGKEEK